MKIGLLSDIHATLPPLQAALSLLARNAVDHILCAGDLVDGDTDGDAVVARLRADEIPCVQGNHDRDAFADQSWVRRMMREHEMATHPLWLSSETTAYVSRLPRTRHLTFGETSICLAHGTPWSNVVCVFPYQDAALFRQVTAATDADVIVLGHTHMPMCVRVGSQWVVNPGSVYRNRDDGRQTCAVLHLPTVTLDVFDIVTGEQRPVPVREIDPE